MKIVVSTAPLRYTRRMKKVLFILTWVLVAGLVCSGCERVGDWVEGQCLEGDLDRPRYCDRTGNLVADPPMDSERWNEPETLIFAYTPVEDPSQYREVWEDFLEHMERITGKRVRFFAAQSNAAQIEAMRAGRLHIAGFATGSVPRAVNCSGFVPLVMMALGEEFGYEMELITHRDSGITSVEEIRGRTLAFTSQTSNSGYKTPVVLLEEEYGLVAGRDYEITYSGGHDNSLFGVHRRDYDVAAVANEVTDRIMDRDGRVPREEIRILYRSDTFPTTAFGTAHNLHPDLAAKIEEAFLTYQWEGTALASEFQNADRFIPITYQEHWAMIRQVDAVFEDGYRCR